MNGIKPSEKEKESVAKLVELFSDAIEEASENGDALISVLSQSFLSLDEKALAEIRKTFGELGAKIWKLSCKLHEMREFPERVVDCETKNNDQEWCEF